MHPENLISERQRSGLVDRRPLLSPPNPYCNKPGTDCDPLVRRQSPHADNIIFEAKARFKIKIIPRSALCLTRIQSYSLDYCFAHPTKSSFYPFQLSSGTGSFLLRRMYPVLGAFHSQYMRGLSSLHRSNPSCNDQLR